MSFIPLFSAEEVHKVVLPESFRQILQEKSGSIEDKQIKAFLQYLDNPQAGMMYMQEINRYVEGVCLLVKSLKGGEEDVDLVKGLVEKNVREQLEQIGEVARKGILAGFDIRKNMGKEVAHKATEVTTDNIEAFLKENNIAVLDFWAGWCGPCKALTPVINALVDKYPNIAFGAVDTEAQKELALKYKAKSLPTLIFFKDGVAKETIVGYKSMEELVVICDGLLS